MKIPALENFINELPEKMLRVSMKVLFAFLVLIIGVWLIKVIRKILKKTLSKANADIGVVQFLDSFAKTGLYIILLFIIANTFGLEAASIVAVIGSAGLAIGLALQGSLSNLAGGVLILLLKPFKVGDYIKEDSNANEGTVKEITMFYTKLVTGDNKTIVIPNGTLANNSMTNFTTATFRRLDFVFGISYDSDIQKAKEILLNLMKEDADTLKDKDYVVYVNELAASSINIGARCYVSTADYWNAKWRLTEKVKEEFDKNNIDIPYNQLDIHVKESK